MTNDQHAAWIKTTLVIGLAAIGGGLLAIDKDAGWWPMIAAGFLLFDIF